MRILRRKSRGKTARGNKEGLVCAQKKKNIVFGNGGRGFCSRMMRKIDSGTLRNGFVPEPGKSHAGESSKPEVTQ